MYVGIIIRKSGSSPDQNAADGRSFFMWKGRRKFRNSDLTPQVAQDALTS